MAMKLFEKKRFWLALIVIYFTVYGAGFAWFSLNRSKVAEAASWYNNSWNWRKKITINASQIPDSTSLSNFPVMINITDAGLQANAQTDGDDILFTSTDATTKLDHEIELYTTGTGQLVAWVKIPTLSDTSNTDIYMYYGNAAASNQQNVASVWSSASFSMVHHLEETGAPPASYVDSTSNANNSSAITFTNGSAPTTSGLANGGVAFNNDIGITLPDSATIDPATTLSISAWINPNALTTPATRYMMFKLNSYDLRYNAAAATVTFLYKPNALTAITLTSAATAGAGNWIHVTGQREAAGAIRLYVNGVQQAATGTAGANLQTNTQNVYLGSNNSTSTMIETLDEVRVSSVSRTAQWLQTEYNNMSAPGSFYTVASAEAGPQITFAGLGTAATGLPRASNQYLGGGFVASLNIGQATISAITLREAGTLDGLNEVNNAKLYYEYDTSAPYNCSGETFAGTERKFGLTATGGFSAADAGSASIASGSVTVTDTQAVCFYPVVDFEPSFSTTKNFVISINNPSTDVTATATVVTNSAVSPSGTGTVDGSLALDRTWPPLAYRKELSIDDTKVAGSDDHYMFPVLVSITDADLQSKAQADGDDIYFTNTYGVKLDHEIESYNSGTGALIAWVEMPHLYYNATTPLVMYYGNSTLSSQQNATGVWDNSDYRVVQHLEEATPLVGGYNDSTTNANNSTSLDLNAGSGPTTGLIGTGLNVVANDSAISITGNASQISDPITISAWVSTTNTAATYPLHKGLANYYLQKAVTTGNAAFAIGGTAATSATPVISGSWFYLVATKIATGAGAVTRLYVNGTLAASSTGNAPSTSATTLCIGSDCTLAGAFIGKIDEARVSAKTDNVDWILTEYNNQGTPGTFLSVGTESTRSNVSPSLASVVLNSGSAITLTEGTTTSVSLTGTISDLDGYTDIVSATGVIFRSGVGQSCSADANNCYAIASCSITGCAGNSCTATCTTNLQHFAEPTDAGTYISENYLGRIVATDILSATGGANTASGVELQSLVGLSIPAGLNAGIVTPGTNTGATNSTITVRNTGNVAIDGDISGGNICTDYPTCAAPYIPVNNLKYSLSPFTYASGGTALSAIAATLNLTLAKQTAVGVNSESTVYWGINIPAGLINGDYSSTGTLTAKLDS
jgi:hypothetical protein